MPTTTIAVRVRLAQRKTRRITRSYGSRGGRARPPRPSSMQSRDRRSERRRMRELRDVRVADPDAAVTDVGSEPARLVRPVQTDLARAAAEAVQHLRER